MRLNFVSVSPCVCQYSHSVSNRCYATVRNLGCYSCLLSVLCYYVTMLMPQVTNRVPLCYSKNSTLFIVYLTSLMVNFCIVTACKDQYVFKMLRSIEICRFINYSNRQLPTAAGRNLSVLSQSCCRRLV